MNTSNNTGAGVTASPTTNNIIMKPKTTKQSTVAAELLALADKFNKIGSLTQAQFLTELAGNDPENRGLIVLEGWEALYKYMCKF